MSKHRPHKDQSCAEADRAADEQIAWLRMEVERLTAELASRPVFVQTTPSIPWCSTPYPTITCSSSTAAGWVSFNAGSLS